MKKPLLFALMLFSPLAHAQSITVFAAASLTDAFKEIGSAFQNKTGVEVTFQFAGSQVLRTQLEQGAKADVYASASDAQFDPLVKSGLVNGKQTFTRNQLVVIVPLKNPAGIRSLSDLAKPGVKVVVAQSSVPVGQYTRQVFENLSRTSKTSFSQKALKNVVSEETNVRQVALKVQFGEADAGVVYTTDLTPGVRAQVKTIPIAGKYNVVATYPMGTVKGGNPNAAGQFVKFVLSKEGQNILKKWGFLKVK
ncbi:molybdate ABC transporter substrate-binding protein [Deinococcus cellulosilyticus]|uniref:Molybdate-binding protein ModA n=1 Tax=Deinococcus cellulosilyticus (strain DSM 18568 / NBRC 106333 / KACC 11606 / 5516J-15) TaxID=1223518 RepID=A0A511N4A9_DEIC1|nr:molybdate ABC transporter substrate-binding protein [Deinococcus cellulosilyticus]GEM47256.1 molybdate ABC transporter substrate-binding protein [Deinococcus cellulosilyticus NBRC 106333 = KACC 11606]